MRRRLVNGRSRLGACARGPARVACTIAILGGLAAPAQAAPGDIFTFAGTGVAGFGGDGGPATSAALQQPIALAWLGDGSVLVADFGNHRIRRISPGGQITTVAGTGQGGSQGDGGPATSARLGAPTGVAVSTDGGFLVADANANRVRRVAPNGTITGVAGDGTAGGGGDGGPAVAAQLNVPVGVAARPDGGFLVSEYAGHRVRHVSAAGVITRVAGTGSAGFSGDGGAATAARLNNPVGVSTTADGGFLIGDSLNGRVRKVSADGTIATVAGSDGRGYAGDGGPSVLAQLRSPSAAVENAHGAILIADSEDSRLRLVEGSPPADGPPPLTDLPRPLPAPAGVVRAAAGRVYLPIACPPTAVEACRGRIRLFVQRRAGRKAAAARPVVIARGRFSVATGTSKVVKVPLTRAGRRLLRQRREITVRAVVARRGGPNIGQSSEQTTFKVRRRGPGARTAGSRA